MARRLYGGRLTVESRILERINRSKAAVFVPNDFRDIASYPQILRALKQLIGDKKIIRFGYGSYAKARMNKFDGNVYPARDWTFLLMELWGKLKIKWDYSAAVKDYNAGRSTQVPVKRLFVVGNRFARKFNGAEKLYARH
jgi:hypothetical protein